MKCTKIRELLSSDYLDGELEGDARGEVVRHLESCDGCRQFEETVRRAAVEPLRNTPRNTAPASLWLKVQRGIAHEQERGICAALTRVWRSLRLPTYAAASAAAAAIVAVFLLRTPFTPSADTEELQAYLQEQISSLAYHGSNGSGESSNGETANGSSSAQYGTLVEEYLM